ncbi:hypothetical protein HAZT_HAZT003253 [Hyalella azteca]|uniref:39S ribosomal protein L41, mitochondrial n=1 Tax=Hyalella azteca TaxID=294128 RepID=A0A6A0GT04_HYAAZ|nr:hypothetical protein HAZT_HAZT003253 [Hyalella azteca]
MFCGQAARRFSTSASARARRCFKKFNLYEKRATPELQQNLKEGKYPEFEKRFSRGVREPFLPVGGQEFVPNEKPAKERYEFEPFPAHWDVSPNISRNQVLVRKTMWHPRDVEPYEKEFIPEMIPDLILKPYVSYRVPDIEQPEFTAQDLFHAVYTEKIVQDFKEGNLNEDGSSKEPSPAEQLTRDEAKIKVQQTGSDYVW